MIKEKVIQSLNKFDYKYSIEEESINVTIDSGYQVTMNFEDPEKIKIKDKLVAWNYITLNIKMSLKDSILFNSIGLFLFGIYCSHLTGKFSNLFLILMYLLCIFIYVLYTISYMIKLEGFKTLLNHWIKE